MISVAREVFVPLDHDGDYVWKSEPVALPDAVKAAGSNWPDAFSGSYRVADGTATVSDVRVRPELSDSGETAFRVSFTASKASDGARFEIIDISVTSSGTSHSGG